MPEPRRIATAQITMSVHVLLNSADATAAEFAATVDGLTLIWRRTPSLGEAR
ncbi:MULTISPECIES: hypothetical protein [Nocardia]|uniref:hypothetical protein n=1 Tax=Nocardia TaxID=1817 RepID=UPI0012E754FB|nr:MULTISPECIES: hypothetical protein [Nocardia]